MSSLPTRTATFAPLKCRSKWDFLSKLRKDKKKGKQVVFPYENASFASIFLSLSSSIVLLNHSVRQKQTAQSSPFLPNQTAATFSSQKTKTVSKFSLLLLHFSCVLHFDLLFDRPDFFQFQQHVQSLTSSIFCYPTS